MEIERAETVSFAARAELGTVCEQEAVVEREGFLYLPAGVAAPRGTLEHLVQEYPGVENAGGMLRTLDGELRPGLLLSFLEELKRTDLSELLQRQDGWQSVRLETQPALEQIKRPIGPFWLAIHFISGAPGEMGPFHTHPYPLAVEVLRSGYLQPIGFDVEGHDPQPDEWVRVQSGDRYEITDVRRYHSVLMGDSPVVSLALLAPPWHSLDSKHSRDIPKMRLRGGLPQRRIDELREMVCMDL